MSAQPHLHPLRVARRTIAHVIAGTDQEVVMMLPRPEPRWHINGAEWRGDTLAALQMAKAAGYSYIDQNGTYVYDSATLAQRIHRTNLAGAMFVMHWPDPARNNYRYVVDAKTGEVRPMTKRELRGKVNVFWDAAGVYRWRRGESLHAERPHSYKTHVTEAVRVGIELVLELKNTPPARPAIARRLHQAAVDAKHRPVFMALWGLPKCKEKCAAAVGAGSLFAVIYGASQNKRPAAHRRIDKWATQPTWD